MDTTEPTSCENGWVLCDPASSCIQAVLTEQTQTEAKSHCESLGGRLLEIKSAETQAWIENYLTNNGKLAVAILVVFGNISHQYYNRIKLLINF